LYLLLETVLYLLSKAGKW